MVITSCVQGLRSSVSCAVKWAVTEDLDSCYELRGYSRRGWESIRVWGQVKTSVCVWHFWTPLDYSCSRDAHDGLYVGVLSA